MNSDVLFSHKSDNWSTPSFIYQWFVDNGFYDPCPLFGTEAFTKDWTKANFVNPPYSNIMPFVEKGIDVSWSGGKTWFLVPARTDTKWFKRLFGYCDFVFFIQSRLKFGDSKNNAPFPSVLMRCRYYEYRQHIEVIEQDKIISTLEWVKRCF